MDPTEELWTRISALVAADTGAGGLKNTTGNQYIDQFLDAADLNNTPATSFVVFRVALDRHLQGLTSGSKRSHDIVFRLHVYTNKDADSTRERAIVSRIIVLLNRNASMTATSAAKFRPPQLMRTFAAQPTEKLNHRIVEFHTNVTAI